MTPTVSTKPASPPGRSSTTSPSPSRRSGPSATPRTAVPTSARSPARLSRIPDGDVTAWYTGGRSPSAFTRTPIAAPPKVTRQRRESYLRASNYYRVCEFYLRVGPANDPEVRDSGPASVDSFARAAQLMNPAPQPVRFPYEDTTLPGWWIPADRGTAHPAGGDPDGPRPTLLFHGGFDSTEGGTVLHAAARPPPDAATTCSSSPAPGKAAPFATRGCCSARTGAPSSRLPSTGSWRARTWTPIASRSWGCSLGGLLAPGPPPPSTAWPP